MASLEEQCIGALIGKLTAALPGVTIERERNAELDFDEVATATHVNVTAAPPTRLEPSTIYLTHYRMAVGVALTASAKTMDDALAALDALRVTATTAVLADITLGGVAFNLDESVDTGDFVAPLVVGVSPVAQRVVSFDVDFMTAEGRPDVAA